MGSNPGRNSELFWLMSVIKVCAIFSVKTWGKCYKKSEQKQFIVFLRVACGGGIQIENFELISLRNALVVETDKS